MRGERTRGFDYLVEAVQRQKDSAVSVDLARSWLCPKWATDANGCAVVNTQNDQLKLDLEKIEAMQNDLVLRIAYVISSIKL